MLLKGKFLRHSALLLPGSDLPHLPHSFTWSLSDLKAAVHISACTYLSHLCTDACLRSGKGQTAHVAPVDLAEHSTYFASVFNSDQTFQQDANGLQCLPVSIETTQACLHNMVGALYSRSIQLTPATVEVTLRTAKFLGMTSIVIACTSYITKHLIKDAALQVISLLVLHAAFRWTATTTESD